MHTKPSDARAQTFGSFDVEPLANAYRAAGYVEIQNALNPAIADALQASVLTETDWSLVLTNGTERLGVDADRRSTLTAQQECDLATIAYSSVKQGFSCLYDSAPSTPSSDHQKRNPASLTPNIFSFSGTDVLQTLQSITGISRLEHIETERIRFQPGHFMSFTSGTAGDRARRVGCMLDLTRDWATNWGGLLQFMSVSGHIARAYIPRHNTLTVFSAAKRYAISLVSPFACGPRYAILAWFGARN